MTTNANTLTAKAYSERTGIPVQEVTRRLREGRIKGFKKSGRWVIPVDSSSEPMVREAASPSADRVPDSHLSVAEFSRMTYLTEVGVVQYLKSGRLTGRIDANRQWRVDADNLNNPDIKHLVR
ncbi:MAG: hypothetical protein PVH30_06975 [Desulfobacterales bacterium]|jgi:hypothetical protein